MRQIPNPKLPIPTGLDWEKYVHQEEDVAWKCLSEWLGYRGYDLCLARTPPDGGATPLRPRLSTAGASEPFRPQPGEEFVHQAGKIARYPSSWFRWVSLCYFYVHGAVMLIDV